MCNIWVMSILGEDFCSRLLMGLRLMHMHSYIQNMNICTNNSISIKRGEKTRPKYSIFAGVVLSWNAPIMHYSHREKDPRLHPISVSINTILHSLLLIRHTSPPSFPVYLSCLLKLWCFSPSGSSKTRWSRPHKDTKYLRNFLSFCSKTQRRLTTWAWCGTLHRKQHT